jgi:hypothetical protein
LRTRRRETDHANLPTSIVPSLVRVCAYTALLGGYEALTEQPVALASGVDFLCFTDDPTLESKTWTPRLVEPLLPGDLVRSQRALKIRAHAFIPEYDVSLYLDNTVLLRRTPEEILAALLPKDAGLAAMVHSYRETVSDEFRVVVSDRLDRAERCEEQELHYRARDPASLDLRPLKGCLLLRRHNDPLVIAAMERWFVHVLRYSRRDQLSFRFALRETGLEPVVLPLDNHESDYHRWPVGVRHGPPPMLWDPPDIGVLRRRVDALESELALLRATRSWRWTRHARGLRERLGARSSTAGQSMSSVSTSPESSQRATSR